MARYSGSQGVEGAPIPPLNISEQEVHRLLDMDETLAAVEASLRHRAQGLAVNRPRERVAGGPDVHLNTMQAAETRLRTT